MSFILSTIILLASAVSPVAESKPLLGAIDQSIHQLNQQTGTLLDLEAKNPPCDPVRCY